MAFTSQLRIHFFSRAKAMNEVGLKWLWPILNRLAFSRTKSVDERNVRACLSAELELGAIESASLNLSQASWAALESAADSWPGKAPVVICCSSATEAVYAYCCKFRIPDCERVEVRVLRNLAHEPVFYEISHPAHAAQLWKPSEHIPTSLSQVPRSRALEMNRFEMPEMWKAVIAELLSEFAA
ncbi:hypothetical protein [Paucibacter soli]|uniref:hypothetical protein n=1 Tax=Paucibacter soli TaxID=3133433 RepID=UPI0030A298A6